MVAEPSSAGPAAIPIVDQPAPASDETLIQHRFDRQYGRIEDARKGKELGKGKLRNLDAEVKAIQKQFQAETRGGKPLTQTEATTLQSELDKTNSEIFLARSKARIGRDLAKGRLSKSKAAALERQMKSVAASTESGHDDRGVFLQTLDEQERVSAGLKDGSLTKGQGKAIEKEIQATMAQYTADTQGGQPLSSSENAKLATERDAESAQIFTERQHEKVSRAKADGTISARQAQHLDQRMQAVARNVQAGEDDRSVFFKNFRSDRAQHARQTSGKEPWKPGPGQLQGGDTSMYQTDAQFAQSIQGAKWTALKASQGTSWVDPNFQSRWKMLGQKIKDGSMKLRMAYGFLDPGNGAGQAQHFLDTVGIHGKLPAGTRLALDWEGPALNSPSTLKDAADHIHSVTGTWPVIYVEGSMMSVAKSTVPEAPIWEAAYGSGVNKNVPFFQYSSGPNYDHDVFNGNMAALDKFAGWA